MQRGEVWWADLSMPEGSEPGYTRPVVIVQSDLVNDSNIRTVIVATFTSNLRLADMPGNVFVERTYSNLPRDSIVNVSQILTVDRSILRDMIGRLPPSVMSSVDSGLRMVIGL